MFLSSKLKIQRFFNNSRIDTRKYHKDLGLNLLLHQNLSMRYFKQKAFWQDFTL